jgi:hypothetical protein
MRERERDLIPLDGDEGGQLHSTYCQRVFETSVLDRNAKKIVSAQPMLEKILKCQGRESDILNQR